ncbi:Mediator of RNA polymerase II transcription subunit 4 [Linum grandiflorum]
MLQHQIVQSPARLGLTNPNSPSLPNSTPPKFPSPALQSHHHPSSNASSSAAATSSSSSALLSLLPPLPRAQSLLLQMASLVSKLFEVSPNRSYWLTAFRGNIPTFLASQVQSAPPLESSPSSVKEILTAFSSLQTQLFEAVAELQEILDLQDAKQRIAKEIKSRDSQLLSFANKLREAERVLDVLVDDYADFRRSKRTKFPENGENENEETEGGQNTTVAFQLKMSDILSYAHRISYTTFAPPEFGAGQGPLRGALAPAPQDEQMRASQLYNFADLDVGIPKSETKEKAVEAIIEPPPPPPDAKGFGNLAGLLPNITVPSGWKPGMPVQLPVDLPVPPPGWKPGDPLPPLDSIPMPRILEQHAPRGMYKQPETIQVKHVQIDILDQDEDSSDYTSSSDDGSSDDQD